MAEQETIQDEYEDVMTIEASSGCVFLDLLKFPDGGAQMCFAPDSIDDLIVKLRVAQQKARTQGANRSPAKSVR